MIADPWRDYRMSMIAPDAKILFLGTGLTMVDHLLSLKNGGHTGTVTAVSRHGLLPRAHEELRTEPVRIALPDGPLSLRDLLRRVVKAIRETSAAGGDWRAIIDGLRADTPELWARLDRAEQRQFLRHLTSLWSIHRHRMAPSIAARLRSLMVEGQLVVRPARILAVRHHSGRSEARAAGARRLSLGAPPVRLAGQLLRGLAAPGRCSASLWSPSLSSSRHGPPRPLAASALTSMRPALFSAAKDSPPRASSPSGR